jgi:beta-lactam-binding protein with PASTA domain
MMMPRRTVETPFLIGRSLCNARREAALARLEVVVSSGSPGWSAELPDELRVVGQEPPPHARIRRRRTVSVVVDGGAGDRAAIPAPRSGPPLSAAADPKDDRRRPGHDRDQGL